MEDIRFVPNDHGAILTLNEHRKRLLITINLICMITFVPFALRAFMHGYVWLGGFLLAFVATLAINSICVLRGGREFFHHTIVVGCLIVALTLAVHHRGIASVFWTFPVIVTFIFVLPMRPAILLSMVLATSISVLMFLNMRPEIAVRGAASLFLTIGISYIVINIIQELQEKLRRSSEEDPLTGLSNRRQLDDKLAEALSKHRQDSIPAVILLIDIDRFKTINDELGHDVGDRIIQGVAKAVEDNIRKTDTAFRLGGDEFLVLLNGTNRDETGSVTEKIRSEVEKLSGPEDFSVSISIGACAAHHEMDRTSWMKQADVAMYQAKMKGRNCVHFHLEDEPGKG